MSNLNEQALPALDPGSAQATGKGFATKRWLYLIPLIFITYSLAYLDRANYGFASAAGIEQDLGITKGMSSLVALCFSSVTFSFRCRARSTRRNTACANWCSGA